MSVGTWIGDQFSNLTGQSLPMYVGSMFVAVAIRNVSEYANIQLIDLKLNDQIGDVALGLFLSLALMSIQLTPSVFTCITSYRYRFSSSRIHFIICILYTI